MNKTMKRLLTLALAMLMLLSLSVTAFAYEGEIHPVIGTVSVYREARDGDVTVRVVLASGSKNFTIKRSSVVIKPGTTGAKLVQLEKFRNTGAYEFEAGTDGWSKGAWEDCTYTAELRVSAAGTVTVKYKIGTASYTLKVKILDYVNPVKTITLNGVYGGNSFASRTKASSLASKDLALKSTTKNAVLKVTARTGWKIMGAGIRDESTGVVRGVFNYDNPIGSSATVKWGTLSKKHIYMIEVDLVNPKTGCEVSVYYNVVGSAAVPTN